MNEDFIQYVWMHGLFDMRNLYSIEGQKIEIIERGKLNKNSGPDFSNAKIKIDGMYWIGNVEIHIKSDEWFKHKHNFDPAYDNTILHIVYEFTEPCFRTNGSELCNLELKNKISNNIIQSYEKLHFSNYKIACREHIKNVKIIAIQQSLDRALISRIETKSEWMFEWLRKTSGDWHTVFMSALIRSFGFGINGEAFEQLALNLPVQLMCRNAHDPMQIEALLFGVSGFLDTNNFKDAHFIELKNEWGFLKLKHNLLSIDAQSFKHMRMRPGNFPEIRLAQLSALILNFQPILKCILSFQNTNEIYSNLELVVNDYWMNHSQFDRTCKLKTRTLSISSKQIIVINSVVPFLFVYGRTTGNEHFCTRALDMLLEIPSEKNHVIDEWKQLGIESQSAYESQALLELKKNFCDQRLCLNCSIGNDIIQKSNEI
jgi:hypothetical protein